MKPSLLDTVMEKTVVPSFSAMGPAIRGRVQDWPALESYDLSERTVVLTGGTSGIGKAAAELYATLGARLVVVARNREKTEETLRQIRQQTGNRAVHGIIGDLGVLSDVHRVADEVRQDYACIDVLAHNAGALFNTRRRTADGTDLSVELMVAAPFLLTGLLLPQLSDGASQQDGASGQPRRGRVLTMSSGGMYTEPLSVDGLEMSDENYQGAQQYARAKRAQVVLNELWAQRVSPQQVVFHALHPGWVDTPGISEALPGFSKVLRPLKLLRSPREGADTMVWLSADEAAIASSGHFWHDRAIRAIDMTSTTRQADTPERRSRLWQWCENHTGWTYHPPEAS